MRSRGLVIRSIKTGNHNNHHHHNNNHGAAEYVSCARYGGLDLLPALEARRSDLYQLTCSACNSSNNMRVVG